MNNLFKEGQIVRSTAGRDKDTFLVITEVSEKGVMVADGKQRPLEKPKLKNVKHIAKTETVLNEENYQTNRSIRHALNDFLRENIEKGV